MASRIFELIFKGTSTALEAAAKESSDALDKFGDELDDVKDKAVGASKETAEMGSKLFETAEAGGSAEQAFTGITDLMTVMTEQFGVSLGPVTQYTGALAQVGGGVEALLKGGPAFIQSMIAMTASVWAQVTALYAQAAAFVVANAPLLLIIGGIALLAAGILLLVKNWDTITEKVPILGTAFETVKDVVLNVKDLVIGAFTAVPDWLRDHWPMVAVLISGPFAPIVLLATDAFGVRSKTIEAFGDILTFLEGLPAKVLGIGQDIGEGMLDGLKAGLSGTVGFVTGVGGAILDALKAMVNVAIIDPINRALEFHIGGSILGKDWGIDINPPDIPHLAAGGIVTRPTIALIGEAGPEAVVPLGKMGGGGSVFHLNFNGFVGDVGELVRLLDLEVKRAGGTGLVGA